MLENNEIGQLEQISNLMNTQDNRITSDPIFLVQRLVRDYGYDSGWSDNYVWCDDTGESVEPEKIEELNQLDYDECYTLGYFKVYYKERWEFVTVFFTEKACLEYIERNKYSGRGEMRSYVISTHDNPELKLVRKMLLLWGKNEPINS